MATLGHIVAWVEDNNFSVEVVDILICRCILIYRLVTDQASAMLSGGLPTAAREIILEDKNTVEQMQLIQQLDEDDKTTVLKIIDKMLTTKKFKDFFQKNVAIL